MDLTTIKMLGDDGQGNQLWRIGQGLANVFTDDDGEQFVTTDCDGWDSVGHGYQKATEKQLDQLKAKLAR